MPSLMRKINTVSRIGALYRAEKFEGTELCAQHHSYILSVCRNPGISQDGLAKRLCINKSSVARQLSYLEEHGFVERRVSEHDRRVMLVYPTEKAESVLPLVRQTVREWNEYITRGFSEQELSMLADMMDRISDNAAEYVETGERL